MLDIDMNTGVSTFDGREFQVPSGEDDPLPKVLNEGERVLLKFYLTSLEKSVANARRDNAEFNIQDAFVRDSEKRVYRGRASKLLREKNLAK